MKGPSASLGDDEETAALVPQLPAPCPNDDGALPCEHGSTGSSMAVDQAEQGQSSSTAKAWWTKVLPTRGIGLVMSVLVILALLAAGTTSSGWFHLSSSVSLAIAAS
jgi:hypothetical protein